MDRGRWGNNSKGADHHTHPARNTGRLIDIDQPCRRVSAHRSIGTGVNTRGRFTMATMKGKVIPFYINTRDWLRFLMNGVIQLLLLRADLNATPEVTGMTLCTFFRIHFDYFHLTLLTRHSRNQIGFLILENPKSEYRNPKKIRIFKFQIPYLYSFQTFKIWSFEIVSNFEFRASDLEYQLASKQNVAISDMIPPVKD
jgi:hypothetical protein